MRSSRFSEEQIIHLLQQAERGEQSISTLCRDYRMTETTFYRCRKKFGGMTVPDAQRLRELEASVDLCWQGEVAGRARGWP